MDDIVVRSRGEVSAVERGYGHEKLARLIELSPVPVRSARLMLALESKGESAHATADAELAVDGRIVRATSAGDTVFDAVHELERAVQMTFRALAMACDADITTPDPVAPPRG